jgi:hypothetical protein
LSVVIPPPSRTRGWSELDAVKDGGTTLSGIISESLSTEEENYADASSLKVLGTEE